MDNHQVLCVYGVEDISAYKKWIEKKDHHLVFLEDDPSVDRSIDHPNIEVYFLDSTKTVSTILKEIAWKFLFLKIDLTCSQKYLETKKDQYTYINDQFDHMVRGVHLSASYFSDHGLKSFVNIYSNLFRNRSFHCLKDKKNIFKNIPIIICGAGPSLNEAIPVLKKLKDQALIFAGGTALNVLQNHKIKPHLMANIDPFAPKMKLSEKTPYFFSWKVGKENLPGNVYPKILCSSKEPYLFDSWLEKQLHLDFDKLDMGWTVTTFMTSLAIYFGCDPIIFIGNDLAVEKDQIYAERPGSKSLQKKQKQTYVLSEGKKTQKDWLMAAKWIQKVSNSCTKISFFTNSNKGLNLGDRVHEFELSKLLSYPLCPLKEIVHSLYIDLPTVDPCIGSLFSNIYHQMTKRLHGCDQKIQRLEDHWSRQQYDLPSCKMEKSWCDLYLLDPLWKVFKHIYVRNIEKGPFFAFKLELYKTLFFKDVLKEHTKIIKRFYDSIQVSHSK